MPSRIHFIIYNKQVTVMFKLFSLIAPLLVAAGSLTAGDILASPYGVCSHVAWGDDLKFAPQQFQLMRDTGISRVRADFDWYSVEPQPGNWNFSHLDRLTRAARQGNIDLLPILDYDIEGASPAWKHLDRWETYVRKLVGRYRNDWRYWEVWNEQNLDYFWRDRSDPVNYTALLKRTAETIRSIDPGLKTVYGGTAGIPLDFIEKTFAAGAADWFDVMNIHPYNWTGTPEMMIGQLAELRKLLQKYNIDKPFWITEVGWSTARPVNFYAQLLRAALDRIGFQPAETVLAVVDDPENGFATGLFFRLSRILPEFRDVVAVRLSGLAELDPRRHPVLVPAPGEEFPAAYLPQLQQYVRNGGTLILPSGLPFYYDRLPDGSKKQIGDAPLPQFRIGWDTWWVRPGVPKEETYQKPAPGFEGRFQLPFLPAGRFLHGRNLKPGDTFLPIITAGDDQYQGAVAALYRFNSDYKGNIIACTVPASDETVTEMQQAEFIPRTYLIAFAGGAERVYWYNFRSGGWAPEEREAHFGLVRKDLAPKPALRAFRILTELCPAGSSRPRLSVHGKIYLAEWNRPDGTPLKALWTATRPEPVRLTVSGQNIRVLDHLGETQSLQSGQNTITPSVRYVIGASSIRIQPE